MAKPRRAPRELRFENIDNGHLRLRTKPSAKLAYTFIPAHDHPSSIAFPGKAGGEPLLIFLSGLDNPKFIWQKTLDRLFESACAIGAELPPMLFYDRFGCGGSDPDPQDEGKPPEEYHDVVDASQDLHQAIVQIMELKFGWSRNVDPESPQHLPRIVFCAHSFGVSVARVFTNAYPGFVQGVLMIDSAIAAHKAEHLVPNPDDPVSWASQTDPDTVWGKLKLPGEDVVSKDDFRKAVRQIRQSHISGYPLMTGERMRWDHMPQQLPRSDAPKLRGPTQHLPLVTVMTADPIPAALQIAKQMGIKEPICTDFFVPACSNYHAGEPYLQPHGKGKGPIAVHNTTHMVHLDAPETVARELLELVALSSHVVAQDGKNKSKSKI